MESQTITPSNRIGQDTLHFLMMLLEMGAVPRQILLESYRASNGTDQQVDYRFDAARKLARKADDYKFYQYDRESNAYELYRERIDYYDGWEVSRSLHDALLTQDALHRKRLLEKVQTLTQVPFAPRFQGVFFENQRRVYAVYHEVATAHLS